MSVKSCLWIATSAIWKATTQRGVFQAVEAILVGTERRWVVLDQPFNELLPGFV
jgi:hypothetical protein